MLRLVSALIERLGLQRRIMLYVTAGVGVFTLIFSLVALEAIQQSTDLVFRERLLASQLVARAVDSDLGRIQDELMDIGDSLAPALALSTPSGAGQDTIESLVEHWNLFHHSESLASVSVSNAEGRVLWTEPFAPELVGQNVAQLAQLENPVAYQRVAMRGAAVPGGVSVPAIMLSVPISRDHQVVGFLIARIDRTSMAKRIEPLLASGGTGYAVELIDENGVLVAGSAYNGSQVDQAHLALVAPQWRAGQSAVLMHAIPHATHVIAFAPLHRMLWGVIVEQPADQALVLPRTLQTRFFSFGLLALLAGLVLAWLTTRAVVRPVNALIHASQAIALGNLDHPLDLSGSDEVGRLSHTFDDMRNKLNQSRAEVVELHRGLEARVERRTRELAALVASSHALTSTLDLDRLFAILMGETRAVLPAAEAIALFLFDPEDQRLVVRSSAGLDSRHASLLRFRIGEGVAGRTFEDQAPILLPTPLVVRSYQANLSADNRINLLHAAAERSIQSAMGVPLSSKGARLGVLMLYNFSREGAFSQSDVAILQALADQAAAALENARLYAELHQKEILRTQLLEKVINAQEEERKRIARDLHDGFAQTLTALMINLQSAGQHLPSGLATLKERLAETHDLTAQTLKETSQWILELRPSALDDLGLVPAIRWYAQNRLEDVGTQVVVEANGPKRRLPAGIETALFRIVQEAVSNIAKHARAKHAHIVISYDARHIRVLLEDDGRGFDLDEALTLRDDMRGLGLLGMRERATLLGGTLTIQSQPSTGTRVQMEVPWTDQT
jgi:signal transduction histidine kinase